MWYKLYLWWVRVFRQKAHDAIYCRFSVLTTVSGLPRKQRCAKRWPYLNFQADESEGEAYPGKERTLGNAQSNDGRGASAVQRAESLHLSGELQ